MREEQRSVDAKRCPKCGRPLDSHNRHVRFMLPDPVLEVPEADRAARTWGNDVLMQVQGVGCFVRVLLPVRLSGGYQVTFGTWLAVSPEDLRRSYEVWWQPNYTALELGGWLANAIPPWDRELLAKPACARVQDSEQVPYVRESADPLLSRVLSEEWPHEEMLSQLPD